MKKQNYIPYFSIKTIKRIFLCLFLTFSITLYSQDTIISKIDSAMGCTGDTLIIPVHVTNFNNVNGFSTSIDLDPSVLTYNSIQNIHSSLLSGSLLIFQPGASLNISWINPVGSATLPDGILYELVFIYHGGSCCLNGSGDYLGLNTDTTLWIDGCVRLGIPVNLGNDTTLCCNETLTLHTGTSGYNYMWSTGETTDTIVCSATTDTIIEYSVIVSNNNNCIGTDTIIVTFDTCVSNFTFSITGILTYDDTLIPHQPLTNTLLILQDFNGLNIDSTYTDQIGYYQFDSLSDGKYFLESFCTKTWGGINSTDVLMIMYHFINLYNLSGLRLKAADVNSSGYINSMDVLYVAQRFVLLINSFPGGDWVFEKDVITINGANTVHNFKGLCVGDVNGSYIVP